MYGWSRIAQVSTETLNHSNKLDSWKEAVEYNIIVTYTVNCRLLELAMAF